MDIKIKSKLFGMIGNIKQKKLELEYEIQILEDYIVELED